MRAVRGRLSSERGSVVVMFAVSLLAMLALAALAVDLGLLRDSRAQAQRAADAIALAGATAFRDFPTIEEATADSAAGRALEIARLNMVRADTLYVDDTVSTWTKYDWGKYAWGTVKVVETRDVTLNIIPDSQKVRAWVRRQGIRTSFGKLLGVPFGHVQAMATAWATTQGEKVSCLKPFVIPDRWYESDKTTQDINSNNYMEPQITSPGNETTGESWKYQPPEAGGDDYYLPYDPNVANDPTHPQTGYGSGIYTGNPDDLGLPLFLTPQTGGGNDPSGGERMGNVFWLLNTDPNLSTYEQIVSGCGTSSVGTAPTYASGSRVGQVQQGIDFLVNEDPNATWDPSTKQVVGSSSPDWTQSPRVITIALIDPKYWISNTRNSAPDPGTQFNNFARVFLMPPPPTGPPGNIQALFLGPAPGVDPGTEGGSLVKVLQLIQ